MELEQLLYALVADLNTGPEGHNAPARLLGIQELSSDV